MRKKNFKKTTVGSLVLLLGLIAMGHICLGSMFLSGPMLANAGTGKAAPAAEQILFIKLQIRKNPLTQIESVTVLDTFLRIGKLKESSLPPDDFFSIALQFSFCDSAGALLARQTIEHPLHKSWEYVESDQRTLCRKQHESVSHSFYLRVQYQSGLNSIRVDKTEKAAASRPLLKTPLARLPIEISTRPQKASGPIFEIVPLLINGPKSVAFNLVILAEGYTAAELSKFMTDASAVSDYLLNTVPYDQYRNNFNVYAIKVISNVSGAAMSPYALIDNYFGSTYWYAGIERLLVPTNSAAISEVLADHLPEYDQTMVIVNHSKYGGSGGWVATSSTHESAVEIMAHEIGHSFINLKDEYWAGSVYASEGINLTRDNNINTVRWKLHLGLEEIGIYPHSESPDWFRPHQNCKMRYLGPAFCRVCRYATIAKISGVAPSITVTSPIGAENWTAGSSHAITWTSTGTIANINIGYSTNSGGNWTSVAAGTANDGSTIWTVPSTPSTTCLVRVSDAADNDPIDSSDAVFTISASAAETVSTPNQPSGTSLGLKATSYPFSTGGSTSSLGHTVQYKIDWDDGSDTGWLASGTTGASHSWAANGTYDIRAMARCVTHTTIESLWSATHAITISDSGTLGKYNSPAQQKILPEVIWAAATGGGTWMSEVQVTDISGGSQVSVYYSTSAGRRGPFALWNNSGGALRSQKYNNLLQTIDGLDSGVFTYYGTVGAVEFVTQDAAHVLQVMARTLNGSYSKTFPAFSAHDANTANTSRVMIVANLTSNSTYRSSCGMYNPTGAAVTVELRLRNAANTQIGTKITKTLGAYGFSAFLPFNDAGVAYPANSFDNVILEIQPTSGTGKVLCFGASANNVTNDPAAHFAVQYGEDYDNGPSRFQILPEAIWATATGGGTWMSEVQIVDMSGGSTVTVHFDFGGGNWRGPIALWTGSGPGAKVKYANILQQIETIDSGFAYYGRVGALEFRTQDETHVIQVTARTRNGNYSKTFPGLNRVDAETADATRSMLIQNCTNNSVYRSTCGFFNPTEDALTVEFTLLNGSGIQIGVPFSKTFSSWDFQAFSPFNEAGVAYPANSFDNVILRIRPTSGTGQLICFGASANNASNDPAAHLAVQAQ